MSLVEETVEVVVVVERLQHVEQFARKREPVQVFVNIDLHEVDTVLAGRFGIEQQRRTAECFVQQGESVVYVAEDVDREPVASRGCPPARRVIS